MFVACGIWCLADVSSVSPSSEPPVNVYEIHGIKANSKRILILEFQIYRSSSYEYIELFWSLW